MAELPSVLIDPPWRRTRGAEEKAEGVPALEPEAARLVWRDGERETFLGPPPRAITARAEEQLHERLLEDVDGPRPLALSDLARVTDAHLAELQAEMKPRTIDEKVHRHLLARLGDAYVPHAVALAKAALAQQGLFDAWAIEAMGPLRAPELVVPAAQLFAQRDLPTADLLARPYIMKPVDAWLLRHAELALPRLAARDDRPARIALTWIAAAGGSSAAPPSAVAAFTPLAALGRPWLAFLAARGLHGQVLALLEGDAIGAGALLAARALAGGHRAAAKEWLARHRAVVEPILRASTLLEASTACSLLDGDETAGDPDLDFVPAAAPALPALYDPAALPAATLSDGTPLSTDAMRVLGELLQLSTPTRPLRGIAEVRAACDPLSLDELAVAVLDRWQAAGEPTTDLWVLDCAALLGGERAVREVATRVRSWARGAEAPRHAWDEDEHRLVLVASGDRGWGLARAGILALGGAGSDLALTLLDDLARNGSATWLRKEASAALESAGKKRGGGKPLRAAALSDDIVPDLGLDGDGKTTIDLGTRVFSVTFDETLTARLLDAEGVIQKSFPRARKDDDAVKYARAKARFQGLTKDATAVARQQASQLETAMCTRHAWTLEAFVTRFVAHPLLRHLSRGLVWATPEPWRTFRIAEDRTFADEHDQACVLEPAARVVLVHPIDLDAASRARWAALVADYELIQPLPQLARETFTLTAEGERHDPIGRAAGRPTSRGRLFQLARRGWAARASGGMIDEYFRELPSGAHAHIAISPPLQMGGGAGADVDYTVTRVSCTYSLDRLPAIDFSELARDATYLVGE